MKIVAGLGSIDEYIPYVRAGADELFCGYVPESWQLHSGPMMPLNRREVVYYNVQIGSLSELKILRDMILHYGVPVTITLNSLYYLPEQYPVLAELILKLCELGFSSFIIADPALFIYLKNQGISGCRLHVSGETAEVNHQMIEEIRSLNASRIIFHRKVTTNDMASCIQYQNALHPDAPLEYEAFVLNEMCHFTGAFCNSLHCDELAHMCHVPCRPGGCSERLDWAVPQLPIETDGGYLPGRTGCGLCALWALRRAGITHLKLVSRGNYEKDTMRDILTLRCALDILEQAETEEEYKKVMRTRIFGDRKCSGRCYYL